MSRLLGFGLSLGVSVILAGCGVRENPAPVSELSGFSAQEMSANGPVNMPSQNQSSQDIAVSSDNQSSDDEKKAPQLVMKPSWEYIQNEPKKTPPKVSHDDVSQRASYHELKYVTKAETKIKPSTRVVVKTTHKTKVAKAPVKEVVQKHPALETITVPVKGKIASVQNNSLLIASKSNQPVVSVKGGSIVYVGPSIKGTGKLVIIKHKDGVLSAYSHLGKTSVKEGQAVAKGQMIGRVSIQAGEQTIAFEVRKNGSALNPQQWLNA